MSSTTTTTMHTVKLVVIGASGVGKTSLRGQYISGRLSNGYRATIGADFIAKTLPHPTKHGQMVTLQIWDTAGQERFSSLSTAFFRGADAVIMMFDVHQIDTLEALRKWWAEFCERAPLAEEDLHEYPCFVVGNKIDLTTTGDSDETLIPWDRIQQFLADLMPAEDSPPPTVTTPSMTDSPALEYHKTPNININVPAHPTDGTSHKHSSPLQPRSFPKSASKFSTVSSINTTLSIYHTPSSSLFDDAFHTARSSPEPFSTPSTSALKPPLPAPRQRRLTNLSSGSTSSESAATITPSLFARSRLGATAESSGGGGSGSDETARTTPPRDDAPDSEYFTDPFVNSNHSFGFPPPPERGPSLSFTSAKTGEGVKELFEHVAARVMSKVEYEEFLEERRMHFREASGAETIRLGNTGNSAARTTLGELNIGSCCT